MWIGGGPGGFTSSRDGHNRLTEINGHRPRLSLANRAVYALQPDYSVRDLELTEPDLSKVLDEMAKLAPIEDDIWTNKLAPRLCVLR
jgi:hypothetical protein